MEIDKKTSANLDFEKTYELLKIQALADCKSKLISILSLEFFVFGILISVICYYKLDQFIIQKISEESVQLSLVNELKNNEVFREKLILAAPPVAILYKKESLILSANGGTSYVVTCPHGMYATGGGLQNDFSKVKVVNLAQKDNSLYFNIDNNDSEPRKVIPWASCIKATELSLK